MKSNWQLQIADGSGSGPNQLGLAEARLGVWQAFRAIGYHDPSLSYYELMEARYVGISEDLPEGVTRGTPDTVSGQREKESAWQIKVVTLP